MLFGHRNDPQGFHRCLREFDAALPDLLGALREGDLLILTSDHGCDPTSRLDRPFARARAAPRACTGQRCARRGARRLVLGRRRDRGRLARRSRRRPARRRDRPVRAVDLVEAKRDGGAHSAAEIAWLIDAFTRGEVAAEQMSAWCMAVVFRGLTDDETDALCDAMVGSGEVVDLSSLGRRIVDKHSTGGVGDKTTLTLAPLVAACGVPVAKMSGRGLSHTGGTLDKLEAIPGFRVGLSVAEMIDSGGTRGLRRRRADGRARAGGWRAVCAARRHRHRAGAGAHRDLGDVEEAGCRRRRDPARRQGRRRRVRARPRAPRASLPG